MSELKECPFCGSSKVGIASEHDSDTGGVFLSVKCYGCRASSGAGFSTDPCPQTYQEVRDEWNRRATPADHISQARDAWIEIGARVPAKPGFYLAMMVEENSFGYPSNEPVLVEFDVYTTRPKQFVISDSWTNGPEDCTTEMTHWMSLPAPPEKPAGDVSDI